MSQFFSITLFSVFLLFCTTVLADRERDSWKRDKIDPYSPKCKPLMSAETLAKYDENFRTVDNDEIRTFYVCMLENAGYMTEDKINIEVIEKDFEKHYQPTDKARAFGKNVLNTCNEQAQSEIRRIDIAGRFIRCAMEKLREEI